MTGRQGKRVKKVKSLVKRIIGKSNATPFTIDMVQRTATGFCIIGWYFSSDVTAIDVVNKAGESVDTSLIKIARDDVFQATGKKAQGFELHVYSSESLANFRCLINTNKGQVEASLPISGELSSNFSQQTTPVASATSSKSSIKAASEFVIETPTHLFFVGWILDNKQAENFRITDDKENVIATLEDGIRIQRKDVIDAFGDNTSTRAAGVNYLFKKSVDEEITGELSLAFDYKHEEITVPIENIYQATSEPSTNAMRLLNNWHPHAVPHLKKAPMFATVLRELFPADITANVTRFDFNEQPENPDATLVIPLYGRYDFMRYQLSHFARTKQTENCEVIYVVDDPNIAAPVMKLAREMQFVSTQPFTVLQLSRNLGFGKANNVGVKHAKADIVALINSDILPKTTDWLDKLIETVKQPEAGIVGARLLFEDESLQHDGMAPMTISEYPGMLFNDHPRKGWPKELSPFNDAVEVCPLITAACWVMKKSLYDELEGFAPEYVLGDFEDSDMCLRALEMGMTNFIRRDVELYHLERQSQNLVEPGRWKHNITILNAVHFNKKWKSTLDKMEKVGA